MVYSTDLFQLEGSVAVVTGAFGKLGPVWCRALLDAGASVLALDRPGAKQSEAFIELMDEYGSGKVVTFQADVTDRASLEASRDYCSETFGTPTILVNNAGIDQPPAAINGSWLLEEVPFEVCQDIMTVNTLGSFLCSQVFGSSMVANGKGSIINIGSMYASVSPDQKMYDHIPSSPPFLKPPAYGASKAALLNLTRFFAAHWGGKGVRVNSLSPGGVAGGQDDQFVEKFCNRVPMGRMAVYEDLKGPLLFLAAEASSYVTGIDLKVDGGFTCW